MNLLRIMKIFIVLWIFVVILILSGCVKNIKGIPCKALKEVYYIDIKPQSAEEEVLKNNAVISELCNGN
jgi:hypothetical protein